MAMGPPVQYVGAPIMVPAPGYYYPVMMFPSGVPMYHHTSLAPGYPGRCGPPPAGYVPPAPVIPMTIGAGPGASLNEPDFR